MIYQLAPVMHKARRVNWRLSSLLNEGPRSLSGVTSRARIDGGAGLWTVGFVDVPLRSRDDFAQWSATEALLDGGVEPVIVPVCEPRLVPWPLHQGRMVTAIDQVPHSDGSFFSDATGYSTEVIVARFAAAALAGATTVQIEVLRSGAFRGGERFSVYHPVFGWRLYVIRTIDSMDGAVLTVTIRAPLWEGVAAGGDVIFDRPRCTMVLAAADGLERDTDLRRFGTGSASFIEFGGAP
ncbi:hypothetical protein [Zavarzinia sp.]|uniref:hypothetical protein n=1 Tax=Zavarzinia sp. TaxID=2027920 RepID=UPI003BB4A571